jgi:Na+/melibiose symporter-like transporter
MITKNSNAASYKDVSMYNIEERMQRLRVRRFGMSVATYAVAILATFLITRIGIGELSVAQWTILICICLFGISLFFIMFYTNANLRFSEPSLTREQIIYSFFYAILAMYWLPKARPMILLFFLPPFSFGVLSLTLRQYLTVVACVLGLYAALLGFEYFRNRAGFEIQYQLFLFVLFGILLTWFAFFGGFVSNMRRRLRAQKEETNKANEEIKIEIEERKSAQLEKDNLIVELKDALHKVKTLGGLLPICASCKKIRDDNGYWNQIESYIKTHSEAEFSHGICPDCAKRLYPDIDLYDEND